MFSITYRLGDFEVVLSADTIEDVLALDDAYGEEDDVGWITWNGRERPVSYSTIVSVKLRSGVEHYVETAGLWYWRHRGHPNDIVAYKVVK